MTRGRLIALCSPMPGCGKSTVAQHLCDQYSFVKLAFATPLKQMTVAMLRASGMDAEEAIERVYGSRKEEIVPVLGRTSRYVQQRIGTEFGRDCIDPDVWVRITMAGAQQWLDNGVSVVIDDMRFPNEHAAIVAAGGLPVRVTRPDAAPLAERHPSEGQLDGVAMTTISNAGTIVNLTTMVDALLAHEFT